MVDAVAHQVRQRVLDGLEDGLVELGVPALHLDTDLLAQADREVADDAGQLVPDVVDGLHAGLHDPLLQLTGDEVQAVRRTLQLAVLASGGALEQLVAGEHELAHQVHQLVEQVDVHPDAAVGDGAARAVLLGSGLGSAGDGGSGLLDVLVDMLVDVLFQWLGVLVLGVLEVLGLLVGLGVVHRGVGSGLGLADRRHGRLSRGRDRGRLRGLGGGGGGLAIQDVLHPAHQQGVVGVTLGAGRLDLRQQRADGVDHLQQHGRELGVQRHLSVPQAGQQALTDVRDGLEGVEREESAGALDGVHRAEDARQQLAGPGFALERDQVPVQLVQILVTLDEELGDDVVHDLH